MEVEDMEDAPEVTEAEGTIRADEDEDEEVEEHMADAQVVA